MLTIDVNFDFTSDTPRFWDGFWERRDGLGLGATDPDSRSKTMREYHRIVWSKMLPCGEKMELECDGRHHYLKWKDFGFSSDSITASFRYYRNKNLLEEVAKQVPDYKAFVEAYLRKLYTIGGEMIYPEGRNNLNTIRGCNPRIKDRWDLTLECIRRHYVGEVSPLTSVMERDRAFYDLFVDFKGYVDFFFFQDLVTEDYSAVKLWLDTPLFEANPIPKDVQTYLKWIQSQLDFVEKRNKRIKNHIDKATQEKEHLYIGGEGGYQKIVYRAGKYVLIKDETALADFLNEEDLNDIALHFEREYNSLEDALTSFSPRKIKAIKEGKLFKVRISDELKKFL